jgi:hypothetical protein
MADLPEMGRPTHQSLGEMLTVLKEHPEACTLTPFPAVGMTLQLAHLTGDRYRLTVRRIDEPGHIVTSEVLGADGVAFRFVAMQTITDIVTRKMAAGLGDEAEQYLAQRVSDE